MDYKYLLEVFASRDVNAYLIRPEQLVISTSADVNPNPFTCNSFWITHRSDIWYISTWANRAYLFQKKNLLVDCCLDCLKLSSSTISKIPSQICSKYYLVEIPDEEWSRLFEDRPDDRK